MRVLLVVHGFPPLAAGGAEIYARAHALALHQQYGDTVLVLTRESNPSRPEYEVRTEERDGLRIVWVNNTFRHTRSFEETHRNDAIDRIASDTIDRFRPDVAHVHHLTCLSTTIVHRLAERRIPCFVTLHDYWLICHRGQLLDVDYQVCEGPDKNRPAGCPNCLGPAGGVGTTGFVGAAALRAIERRLPAAPARQWRRLAERAAVVASKGHEMEAQSRRRLAHMREVCDGVTHFFAPSTHMRDRFVQFGIAPDRITLAGYGFDNTPFHDVRRIPSGHLRLGFLGSLMVSKGPHVLLEAVGRLPRGSVTVDLFGAHTPYHGDDKYRETLAPLLNLPDVRAHGPVPHERVPEALASIDVLVVPSIWPENSPLVIQEAFLAGVPVVASRIGGIPEVVTDNVNGLLFSPRDSEDLARCLTRLMNEPGLLDRLRGGLPPVRSLNEDVQLTRSFYRQDLGGQSARPRLAAVVLNFRTPDDTLLAVKSLLASRRPIDNIIVVDNSGNDDARRALQDVWSLITYTATDRNLGFSGGMNVGIREALASGADRVLLLNSDVIVPPDCTERLEQCLDASEIGIAGPVVLSRSQPDRVASLGMSYSPATGRMRHRGFGRRADEGNRPFRTVVDGISGCLMLIRREVFDTVGLLDEQYFFGFEDLDFCLRARSAGFTTVVAGLATAFHEGGRAMGATSVRRLYFAARNHLLVARRAAPSSNRTTETARALSIVMLNVGHAIVSRGGSLPARLGAVARGTRDFLTGRFGADSGAGLS